MNGRRRDAEVALDVRFCGGASVHLPRGGRPRKPTGALRVNTPCICLAGADQARPFDPPGTDLASIPLYRRQLAPPLFSFRNRNRPFSKETSSSLLARFSGPTG